MKSTFLVILICISSLVNAQSNQQRLDDIDFELEKRKLERSDKEFNKQLEEIRRIREKNNDSPYIILDGKVIDVNKSIRDGIKNQFREDWCALTWNGKTFIKDNSNKDDFSDIRVPGLLPLQLFFQNKRNSEIEEILRSGANQKQMIRLCPVLKDYSNVLDYLRNSGIRNYLER